MMGSETPSGVLDGSPDGVGDAPSGDESFWGETRQIPRAYGGLTTPVQAYFSGRESFQVVFGEIGAAFELWTDVRGLDAIIDACMAAKVRAA